MWREPSSAMPVMLELEGSEESIQGEAGKETKE